MEIRPGLHRIVAPLGERFIAMYLLTGARGALLFDTGVEESVSGTLTPYLGQIGLDPTEIRWTISSHCDFDHTGGNGALRELAPDVELLAGRDDVPMTEDIELLIRGRYGEFADADGFDDPPEATAEIRRSTRLVTVDRALEGGEVFDLGDRRIEVLRAPGHSPGHLALWDPVNRALLISDAVLGESVLTTQGAPIFPPTYRDVVAYTETITRLRSYRADLLLTAHYPVYEGAHAAGFLNRSAAYVDRIDQVIADHLRSGEELTSLELIHRCTPHLGSWSDAAAEYLIFPMTGNLERLAAAGTVREGSRAGRRTWRWVG
ncbi:MBL fold metallo-hydrolase [Ruania halotolerans]|uniref:MBL fold metallo-hydrolase n=1 Tax=Ruania halotolerans TaxID=2897773 RepID=UPI001E30E7DD|nr:MBL fold metallo-hydrolase [Ruania halotolerans]UFU06190.1 MBL fold metallo-hydrolase [Ruania halotolerans]